MANGAGQSAAKTFLLPQRSGGGDPNQLGIDQFGTGQGPQVPSPVDNLVASEELTTGYFEKFGQLQSFAQGMWHNFAIDVTKPDFSNPDAVKAHTLYRKALADLQYQGVELQNIQKRNAANFQMQGTDPDFRQLARTDVDAPRPEDILDDRLTTNIGIQDRVKTVISTNVKTFDTQKQVDAADGRIKEMRSELSNELVDMLQNEEYGEAETLLANIQALDAARADLDANSILNRQQTERLAKAREKTDDPIVIDMFMSVAEMQGGNLSRIRSWGDKTTGRQIFSDVEYIMSDDGVVMIMHGNDSKVGEFTREISMSEANQGGLLAFVQLINDFGDEAEKVSVSKIRGLGRKDIIVPNIYDEEGNLVLRVTKDVNKNYIKGRNEIARYLSESASTKDKERQDLVEDRFDQLASDGSLIMPKDVPSKDRKLKSFDGEIITSIKLDKEGIFGQGRDRVTIKFQTANEGKQTIELFSDNKSHMKILKNILDRNTAELFQMFEELGINISEEEELKDEPLPLENIELDESGEQVVGDSRPVYNEIINK